MMGHRQVEQAALFYEFSLDKHIPADHLLRCMSSLLPQSGHSSLHRVCLLSGVKRSTSHERLGTHLSAQVAVELLITC